MITAPVHGPGRVAEWLWREVQVKNFSEFSPEILLTQVAQVRVLPRSLFAFFSSPVKRVFHTFALDMSKI